MSELSDWKRLVLPGLIADAEARGRGEAADELATLRTRLTEVEAENERLRDGLTDIAEAYDARSELYTSDEDCAVSLAARARAALAQTKEPEHD